MSALALVTVLACSRKEDAPDPGPPPEGTCATGCAAGFSCVASACSAIRLSLPYAAVHDGRAWISARPHVLLQVTGAVPSSVALTLDGVAMGGLRAGIQEVVIDPGAAEGGAVLRATATYPGGEVLGDSAAVTLDRTPPELALTPGGIASLAGVTELLVRATEPLDPRSRPGDVRVSGDPLDPSLPAHEVTIDAAAGTVTVRFERPLDGWEYVEVAPGIGDRAGNPPSPPALRVQQPPFSVDLGRGDLLTSGTVTYPVTADGAGVARVNLLLGDPAAVNPSVLQGGPPPHTFTIDTRALGEGAHAVSAEAIRGARSVRSAAQRLVVDRTSPRILACAPERSPSDQVYWDEPVLVTASEPLEPASLDALTLTTDTGVRVPHAASLAAPEVIEVRGHAPGGRERLSVGPVADLAWNASLVQRDCDFGVPEWHAPSPGHTLPEFQIDGSGGPPALALGRAIPRYGDEAWLVAPSAFHGALGRVLSGAQWSFLAAGAGGAAPSHATAIAVQRRPDVAVDTPVLAWIAETDGLRRARAVASAAVGFAALGDAISADPGASAEALALAVDGTGAPVVAWTEGSPGRAAALHVRRWNGSAWSPLGGDGPWNGDPARSASAPALRAAGDGSLVLAWREEIAPGEHALLVRRLPPGGAWSPPLGGTLSLAARAPSRPSLALLPDGSPLVAWSEPVDGVEVAVVRRWTGDAWAAEGEPVSAGALLASRDPSVGVAGATVWLATVDEGLVDAVRVRRLDPGGWTPVGAPLGDPAVAGRDPVLEVDAAGRPNVAFAQGNLVLFRRYNR